MRHRITLAGKDEQLWLARDAHGYRLDLDERSLRVALTPAEGPPSSFDKLRMRATESGRVAGPPVESLTLSPSNGKAFGPADGCCRCRLSIDGVSETVFVAVDGDDIYLHIDGAAHHLRYHDAVTAFGEDAEAGAEEIARAPMPGIVIAINVSAGQSVAAGDALLVIESMKLETTIRARHDGEVAVIHVAEGETFERDAALVSFAAGAA